MLLGRASTGAESWTCGALLLTETRSMTACENARLFSENFIFTRSHVRRAADGAVCGGGDKGRKRPRAVGSHRGPRTPKLVASVLGHVVICGIIGTCFPGANRFDSFIPMDGSIFSSFSYPDRRAWTTACPSSATRLAPIRFPRANLFKNEDFSNVAACFHDKATLALSTMLTGFALCDVGGDFTVNYNN